MQINHLQSVGGQRLQIPVALASPGLQFNGIGGIVIPGRSNRFPHPFAEQTVFLTPRATGGSS